MTRITTVVSAVAIVMTAGAALHAGQGQSTQGQTTAQARPQPQTPGKAQMGDRDEDFLKDIAQAGQIEIESSQLAATKASNAEVKAYAERIVKEHTDASKELMNLVHAKNAMWTADDPLMKEKKEKHKSLQEKSGAEFDKEYLEDMISDHESVLVKVAKEREFGKDAEIKAFANKAEPSLREHLKLARDLRAKLFK